MPEDLNPNTDAFTALQQQVSDLSDAIGALQYQSWKTLGPGGNSISGSVINSVNFVTGVSGWQLSPNGNLEANNGNFRGDITGATGTFSGTVTVGSLNIPDSTTANSMHVDAMGNTWWGSNVANGISQANASVTSAGAATFKNILIGGATIQFTVNNNGIFSFGDGSSGAGTLDGSTTVFGLVPSGNIYTMVADIYATNITINTGITLITAGYRIFGTGTLTLSGTAVISWNGNGGGNGSDESGGAGGAALADGYLKGSAAGGVGGSTTPNVVAGNGANTANSIGSSGAGGGNGGAGSGTGGRSGGSGGTATASNVALIANWHLATLLDISSTGSTVKFNNSAGAGGGGGGGDGTGHNGGGGGGGGSAGGIIAIYFRNIVVGASASITANGGNGGNGSNSGGSDSSGGGGGGGGGNGGQVILVYNTITNSGTITASKGTGGTKGNGDHTGVNGVAGTDGTAGTVRQFMISI
jgi:hypothetical protein